MDRVSTFIVRALVEVVERAGVKREALLGAAGIEAARLEDIVSGFAFSELVTLEEKALDLTGDEGLGLRLAEQSSEAAFDVVAHLATHAPTLRDAIALCTQFQRLLMDGTSLDLSERGDRAILRCELPRATLRADRMLAEFAMGGFARMIRSFAGHDVEIDASFEHPMPAHARAYASVFRGRERFSRSFTGVEIDRALLDRRQLHQHPELYSVLHGQAATKLEALSRGESVTQRIKQHLMAVPPKRMPDMDGVAQALGLSVRSLRRRLTEEGASFKDLVQAALETHATQMLSDPKRSIQETASELGFSDPAAFQRAFKRWKGVTPGEFRRQRV